MIFLDGYSEIVAIGGYWFTSKGVIQNDYKSQVESINSLCFLRRLST